MINVNVVWIPAFVHLMIQERARFMTISSVMETHIRLCRIK